jgi:hypothetical protein
MIRWLRTVYIYTFISRPGDAGPRNQDGRGRRPNAKGPEPDYGFNPKSSSAEQPTPGLRGDRDIPPRRQSSSCRPLCAPWAREPNWRLGRSRFRPHLERKVRMGVRLRTMPPVVGVALVRVPHTGAKRMVSQLSGVSCRFFLGLKGPPDVLTAGEFQHIVLDRCAVRSSLRSGFHVNVGHENAPSKMSYCALMPR